MLDSQLLRKISNTELNKSLVKEYLNKVRNTKDVEVLEQMADYLASRGVFYTPMDTYFEKVYGKDVRQDFREYFANGRCVLTKKLAIPLETLDERLLGLVLHDTITEGKYKYPVKGFHKDSFMQMTRYSLLQAIDRGYIIIVEGVFDELSLASIDEPVIGLSGPTLSKSTAIFLDRIPVKIVCTDEDQAGKTVFTQCNDKFSGQILNTRLPTKDVDEYLRKMSNRVNFKEVIKINKESNWVSPIISFEES